MRSNRSHRSHVGVGALVICSTAALACNDAAGPPPPAAPAVRVTTFRDSLIVRWALVPGAESYRVELRATGDTLDQERSATDSVAVFTSADGLADAVAYTVSVVATGAGGETPARDAPTIVTNFFPWDENYPLSLHATGLGKQTFYNAMPNQGFERFTNVPYGDLNCKACHQPSFTGGCASCHDAGTPQLGARVDATLTGKCGGCHGRQTAEAITHGYTDAHRDQGLECMDCHTLEDVHGDGTQAASLLAPGAIDVKCEDCHQSLSDNPYHAVHLAQVDCAACHMQSVVSCYNCHFETVVATGVRKAYGQFKNWLFLVNYEGRVHAGNFQSLNYGSQTFVAFAPYYSHTIARNARVCGDCHMSAAVQDWEADGVIDVVTWDAAQSKLVHRTGVIPVPPDYPNALRFDFVNLDAPGGAVWSFLKTGADGVHMVYGTPLTAEQMEKLRRYGGATEGASPPAR
jgi:hypothetical protein